MPAAAFPAAKRFAAVQSWSVYHMLRSRPELLATLASCLEGKRPLELSTIEATYRGKTMTLSAITITSDDDGVRLLLELPAPSRP
jgi:hypothetical protein